MSWCLVADNKWNNAGVHTGQHKLYEARQEQPCRSKQSGKGLTKCLAEKDWLNWKTIQYAVWPDVL